MHPLAAGAIVGTVIRRAKEGDCPTIAAFSVETLEDTLIEVNRMFQAEQKQHQLLIEELRRLPRYRIIDANGVYQTELLKTAAGAFCYYGHIERLLPTKPSVPSADASTKP